MCLHSNSKRINIYTEKRLQEYGLWYYFRYYPSNAKLLQKLNEKGSSEDAEQVFKNIEYLLQEDEVLQTKINTYLLRNKNFSYIHSHLLRLQFPKEKIEKYLLLLKESGESLLSEEFLIKKIENGISKGKSTKEISSKLGEKTHDREKIKKVFELHFPDADNKALNIRYKKIKNKYPNDKLIQKLMIHGFNYDQIKTVLGI